MHMYSLFNILVIFELLGTFLIVFLSFPLFLFMLVVSMAPKHKSTPARNPLHFGASSSSDSSPLPLFGFVMMMPIRHSRRTRWGVHSERQVILANFANTNLLTVIACSLPSAGNCSNIILGVPWSNHKEWGKFKDNVIKKTIWVKKKSTFAWWLLTRIIIKTDLSQ